MCVCVCLCVSVCVCVCRAGLSQLGNFPCGYYGWLNSVICGITAVKKKKKNVYILHTKLYC